MRRRLVLAVIALAACTSQRPRSGQPPCTTWQDHIEPLFRERCVGCHQDLGDYPGALQSATAGDPASRLIVVLDPDAADETHRPLTDLHPIVRGWVVDCRLSYFDSDLHEGGLMNPADPEFHGTLVRELGWDFDVCASCHGGDFSGGAARSSCLGCHEDGPTACTTCHRTPLASGAHLAHASRFGCAECHTTPDVWDAAGHLDAPPAELTFGPFAALDVHPERREGPPTYDMATATCRNVYCHGDSFGDTAATHTKPGWSGGPAHAACGTCHGLPPSDHAPGACETCHGTFDPARHVDGQVAIGGGLPGCSACHGDAASPAPADGGHQAHVFASRLRGPVPCLDCHLVPDNVRSPGHIDSAPPAEVTFSAWQPKTETCTGIWCHGDAAPRWTAIGTGEAACGTCHAIPPSTAAHDPALTLSDCATCHASTVDPFGNILVPGGTSQHIDGEVDL